MCLYFASVMRHLISLEIWGFCVYFLGCASMVYFEHLSECRTILIDTLHVMACTMNSVELSDLNNCQLAHFP